MEEHDGTEETQNDPNKDTTPSPPQQVTAGGEVLPDHTNVPEDDSAEPEDADAEDEA